MEDKCIRLSNQLQLPRILIGGEGRGGGDRVTVNSTQLYYIISIFTVWVYEKGKLK